MTKVIPIAFFSTLILIAGFLTENNISHSYSTGAPAGYSNAPGENNCTSCHSGTLNSGTGVPSITTNIPASGYVGGETYTITAKIVQSGIARFGFEVSVENQSTSHIGSLIVTNSTETQIVSSNYITHKFGGTAGSGSRTWTFNWKAPCAGQDTAIFYGTFNATNSNNSDTGDKIYATKIKVGENLINSADSASQISMSDVNNNYNGSDLRVQFKKPGCESRTSQYRIMVVKASVSASFDSTSAAAVTSGNYTIVTTGSPGSTKTVTLSSTAKDVDGDAIRNNLAYKVFIMSAPKTSLVSRLALVESASSITLTSPMATVNNILGSDVDDQGNGADLEASFKTSSKEGTVSEYRVMAVKATSAGSFSKSAANSLNSNQFQVVNTGSPNSVVTASFIASNLDSDGDPITVNVPYNIFVLSKADGINSLTDTLQASLTTITLGQHAAEASAVLGTDIANNGDGRDLEVSFHTAGDESSINEYRVIAVRVASAPSFSVDDAAALASSSYVTVATGNPNTQKTIVFNSASKDSDGNLIVENEPYNIFVLSINDGTNATLNSMVASVDTVTLVSWTGISDRTQPDIEMMQAGQIVTVHQNGLSSSCQYRLLDMNGHLVARGESASKVFRISLPGTHGIYVLHVRSDSSECIGKFAW